ncbi:ABC transporter ATP-binding protein [Sporolactobacillus kofuensis]|uniref:ABC transporter ATP-binding protein n=1 Tax=Sporolactobacillus kofuensis TaxID=269672 RepID=A0ABW1WHD8_9BACL|nr:sn-glycerol-3-phosphate ABC transporter ATP-binding protein UgpC [Sporolactobacillus kofuensis]MCO7175734.1 sn-glycerol-3-phosphate ABC transporter ATP-binding protein UgpC [Sporolactobacillus kofuensis]
MAELKLDHIYKIYDNNVTAVTDFNLEIADKEFIVFVGPSGCGKSTTLRMIAGLEEISKGDLIIDGKKMNDVAPKNREIAMVFQNYALYPHMTVFDNMAFGLKLRKIPKQEIKERVERVAETLGLAPYLKRKPKALSGGQRQRVALGRAIVRDAKVFLMDEPLSNLDAKLRVQMRSEISKLHQRLQATMIYVTHDQTEAMTMASRIVIMKDGIIQQVGTPKEVYDNPTNLFVGGFIGSPPMNYFEGVIEGTHFKGDGLDFEIPAGKMKILKTKGYSNQPIIMGIRPEDIHDEPIVLDSNPDWVVDAKIIIAELTGAEFVLHSEVGDHQFIARVNARLQYHPQDQIKLAFNLNKSHFFDPKTERSLTAND